MPWGAVAGAVISGVMSDGGDKNGGAGAQQQSRDPWAAAQPWMRSNIAQGQNLQQQYQNQPFNQAQLDSYGNMAAQSDYMRQLIPGLLGTASRQQLGFDRSNPNARPEAYKFDAQAQPGGLLGSLTGRALSGYGAANPPPPQPQQQQQGRFTQEAMDPVTALVMSRNGIRGDAITHASEAGTPFTGSFGDFQYGMAAPQPGTKAFYDMNQYFQYGGSDPMNLYGKRNMPELDNRFMVGGWGGLDSMAGNGGPGSGGVGAAGGAGAGSSAGGPGW